MAARVIPSVLARSTAQLRSQWSLAADYGQLVHLDVTDGTLVSGKTVGAKSLTYLDPRHPVEVHAMTRRPDLWLPAVLRLRLKRVILHVELGAALRPYIALFRTHHIPVVIAINPKTPLGRLRPWLRLVAGVQVMGVEPGQLGAAWKPQAIKRIAQLRQHHPRLHISCDGGMTPATIPAAVKAGATEVIVGSYFHRHVNPDEAWDELRRATHSSAA